MAKKVMEKSQETKLDLLIERFNYLDETIREYELHKNIIGNQIITLLEALSTNKRGNVRLAYKKPFKTQSIELLKNEFNNENGDILNSLIVSLDVEKSLEALKYETNLPEPLVKAIELKLESLLEIESPILVIERKADEE